MKRNGARPPVVEIVGLTKRYAVRAAVDRLDLVLEAGSRLALFGSNGAGKTTLLRMLAQSIRPTAGSVRVAGFDLRRDAARARAEIGLVAHAPLLYEELRARENLEFFARLHGVPDPPGRARELLSLVRLEHRAEDLLRTLSRGMRQRLALARSLVHEPALLLLDEPFEGLDPGSARDVTRILRAHGERGGSMILATHDLELGLSSCESFAVIAAGRVVSEGAARETNAAELASRIAAGRPAEPPP